MIAINEPDLTPAQNEAVRRLLAEARVEEPMPPEVSARLDDVLAGLHADAAPASEESSTDEEVAPVTPLRRRSKVPQMLLAAAAVVAIGFGVTQILPSGDEDGADSTAVDSSDSQAESGGAGAAPESESADDQQRMREETPDAYLSTMKSRRLIDRVPVPGLSAPSDGDQRRLTSAATSCGPSQLARGDRRAVATYEGEPAVVVFHRAQGGKQEADIHLCAAGADSDPLTSVTLTAP